MGTNTLTSRSAGEIISSADINQYKDALITNVVPRNLTGVPTAQAGSLGTSTLPWSSLYADSLIIDGQVVDLSGSDLSSNQIVSSRTTGNSLKPDFIRANGNQSFTILATETPLVLTINGQSITITDDIQFSGVQKTTGNTAARECQVDYADTSFQNSINPAVESLKIDNTGGSIDTERNRWTAWLNNNEIFIGYHRYVSDTDESIDNIARGIFRSDTGVQSTLENITDNITLEILKIGYVFIDVDGLTVDVTYDDPIYAYDEPIATAGVYWFDLNTKLWKRNNGVDFVEVNRMPVGVIVNDNSGCIGSFSYDLTKSYQELNSIKTHISSSNTISINNYQSNIISVYSSTFNLTGRFTNYTWNTATDLDTGVTLTANSKYYFYIKNTGEPIISDQRPIYFEQLKGFYHPAESWRFIDSYNTDASNNLLPEDRISDTYNPRVIDTTDYNFYKGFVLGGNSSTFRIRPGVCRDERTGKLLSLPYDIVKRIDQPFAVGVGNGCGYGFGVGNTQFSYLLLIATSTGYIDAIIMPASKYNNLKLGSFSLPSGFVYYKKIATMTCNIGSGYTGSTIATTYNLTDDATTISTLNQLDIQHREQLGGFFHIAHFNGTSTTLFDTYPNWVLCDGSKGTPDLRDRFIVGSEDSYNLGDTGGENHVKLDETEMPEHDHSISTTNLSGSFSFTDNNTTSMAVRVQSTSGVFSSTNGFTSFVNSNGVPGAADLPYRVNLGANIAPSIGDSGSGQAHENRPPYYALAYIIRRY